MNKQFVIIGLGRFGSSLARTLSTMGYEVLGVDNDAERVEDIADSITHAVQTNATEEHALRALGINNFDVAVVTTGNDVQASMMITLMCKEMGVPFVISKANNDLHAKILFKIGADKVVFPERDMGVRVAHSLVTNNILDFIELSPRHSLVEFTVPDSWIGKSLIDLQVHTRYGVNIMAVRIDSDIDIPPRGERPFKKGDAVVAVGLNDNIAKLEHTLHI